LTSTIQIVWRNIEDGEVKFMMDSYSFGAMVGIQLGVIIAQLSGIFGAINFAICPILITILMDVAFAVPLASSQHSTT
jgi:hypothetical protein